ncbi:CFI-box-CTERM domain-containing protein [Thermodesulfobacteriota bacterium]
MKKLRLLLCLALATMFAFAIPCLAQEEVEYECCCVLTCEWQYQIWNPVCFQTDNASGTTYTLVSECSSWPENGEETCEGKNYADLRCGTSDGQARENITSRFEELCPGAFGLPIVTVTYIETDIMCAFGVQDDCFVIDLSVPDDPRLEILRQFRDEVLSKSAAGRQLIDLYYDYSGAIIEVFNEYPSLKMHVRDLLDKAVPVVEAVLNGGSLAGLLGSYIIAEADLLLEEIDALMSAPLREDLGILRQEIVAE